MDIKALKAKRAKMVDKLNRNSSLWKPPAGESKVRILPYKFNKTDPFSLLHWHWNIGKNSILCLQRNFDEDCPVCQLATKLWDSDEVEDKDLAKKLFAKERFYVPVLIRGEEAQGPKFWGFGQNVFDTLTSRLDDTGDFTDIENGRDIIVVYQSPKEAKNKYGKLDVSFSFNTSTLSSDDKILKPALEDQKEVYELYPRKTFDEVKQILSNWLNPSEAGDEEQTEPKTNKEMKQDLVKEDDSADDEIDIEEKYKKLLES